MEAKPITTDAPTDSPAVRAPLFALLASVGFWFTVTAGHFLLCAHLAHWLGSPNALPASLKTVDQLFQYGISGALDLLLIAVWWLMVLGPLVAVGLIVVAAGAFASQRMMSAVIDGMICLLPVAGLTVLVLLILPMYSHNAPLEPSGLELAEQMSFDAYLQTLYTGLFAIVTIVVLFGGLLLAAMIFDSWLPGGGAWQLIVAILFGIVVAMIFAFVAGPIVVKIGERYGATRAIVGFLALWMLITSGPIALIVRGK